MKAKPIKPTYRCTQAELYRASQIVIVQLHENLKDFAKFKSKYTIDFIENLQTHLANAQALPDYHKRNLTNDSVYTQLIEANTIGTLQWQILKRYIIAAYPQAEYATQFKMAGLNYYTKACLKHWDSSRQLLLAAQNYLNQNGDLLKANENMPPHFPTVFNIAHINFSKQLFNFQQSEQKAKQVALQKIVNNNMLFGLISEVCHDGRLIYHSDLGRKTAYTISKLIADIKKNARLVAHENKNIEQHALNVNDVNFGKASNWNSNRNSL